LVLKIKNVGVNDGKRFAFMDGLGFRPGPLGLARAEKIFQVRCTMRRKEHDRRRRDETLLARVMSEPVLAELLPRLSYLEPDDPDSLQYFHEVQDFLVTPEGNAGIKFKPRPLASLLGDASVTDADVNLFVALEKRRRNTWYFFAKVLFQGAVHREWSEKVSDFLNDHGWMCRTGKRLRVWSVAQVQEGFMALLGLGYRF